MGLKSIHGTYLKDEWKEGAHTYLGTTISGYPNLFHLYGPHGPTLLSNGPSSVEIQVRWIRDAIKKIKMDGVKYINPTKEASDAWKQRIQDLAAPTLFPTTRSTYMGGTVPGKKFEMTCYAGVSSYCPRTSTCNRHANFCFFTGRQRLRPRDPKQDPQLGGLRGCQIDKPCILLLYSEYFDRASWGGMIVSIQFNDLYLDMSISQNK